MAMGAIPSVKGSVFTAVVEDVRKLIQKGEVASAELSRWLKPEDVALLDAEIFVSHWYDVRIYARLNDLLRDVEGGGENEYLRERGRETARRLLAAGLYAQMEYLQRAGVAKVTDPKARFEAFGRDLRLLTTLSGSILSFTRWTSKPDPAHGDRYVIEVTEARDMPEALCWRSDGFVNEMATRHGDKDLWSWRRSRPDVVIWEMTRSL